MKEDMFTVGELAVKRARCFNEMDTIKKDRSKDFDPKAGARLIYLRRRINAYSLRMVEIERRIKGEQSGKGCRRT